MITFKAAVKNLFKLNTSYLHLLKKNRFAKNEKKVVKHDIFIITSCININNQEGYFIHNSNHLPEQRMAETIVGLLSVREYYPDAYIIFIESSSITNEAKQSIAPLINEFFEYNTESQIRIARKHFNKGVPQFTAYLKFMEVNNFNYYANTFHFLGGRYVLTGNVADSYEKSGSYFLYFPEHEGVSTRYYFTKELKLTQIIKPFRNTLYLALLGISVEDVIYKFMPDVHKLNFIKIRGMINGNDPVEE